MTKLVNIYNYDRQDRMEYLWELLQERTPAQSISHKEMPTFKQHEKFVDSKPYAVWYMIASAEDYDKVFGTIYLTSEREIGIMIFAAYRHQGIGSKALDELFKIHKGPFLANINPSNMDSMKFFEKHGFSHIQNTYKLEADDADSR